VRFAVVSNVALSLSLTSHQSPRLAAAAVSRFAYNPRRAASNVLLLLLLLLMCIGFFFLSL